MRVLALMLLCATSAGAQTPVCFSDEQLKSVLIEVHFFSIGQMAGTCAGRFPEMADRALGLSLKLENTYPNEFSMIHRSSVAAFEQHYPWHGKEMRDKNSAVAAEPPRLVAKQWSREQCENVLLTLEGLIIANDWKAVTDFPLRFFDKARTPKC